MNSHCCCQSMRVDSLPTSRGSRIRELLGIVVPSTILAVLPKCPMCLAAYAAFGTGITISHASAQMVLGMLTVLCIGWLACRATKSVLKRLHYQTLFHSVTSRTHS